MTYVPDIHSNDARPDATPSEYPDFLKLELSDYLDFNT